MNETVLMAISIITEIGSSRIPISMLSDGVKGNHVKL